MKSKYNEMKCPASPVGSIVGTAELSSRTIYIKRNFFRKEIKDNCYIKIKDEIIFVKISIPIMFLRYKLHVIRGCLDTSEERLSPGDKVFLLSEMLKGKEGR